MKKQKNRLHSSAFTLIELCLVLAVVLSLAVGIQQVKTIRSTTQFISIARSVATFCHACCIRARYSSVPVSCFFDCAANTYGTLNHTIPLPSGIQFTHTTLPTHLQCGKVTWHTTGTHTPGTITLTDQNKNCAAITLQRAQHAPVLLYWYCQGKWQRDQQ